MIEAVRIRPAMTAWTESGRYEGRTDRPRRWAVERGR